MRGFVRKHLRGDLTKSWYTAPYDENFAGANTATPSSVHSCPIMFFTLQKHFSLAIVSNKEQEQERAWV